MSSSPAYKRILLKLSGEALMGDDSYGINRAVIERIVSEIGDVVGLGVQDLWEWLMFLRLFIFIF